MTTGKARRSWLIAGVAVASALATLAAQQILLSLAGPAVAATDPNQTPKGTMIGPVRITDTDGKSLLGVFGGDNGTVLRFYDSTGKPIADVTASRGLLPPLFSPVLSASKPSSNGP